MNGPKLAGWLVGVIMLGGIGYVAWMSRQAAEAQEDAGVRAPARIERLEQVIRQVEADMGGRAR